jgi:Uma2 family endonuclease
MNTSVLPRNENRPNIFDQQFSNVEEFENWVDGQEFGYEFVNHTVVEKEMIKEIELMIIWWLNKFFKSTEAFKSGDNLISEVGMRLKTQNFRIPDLSYFTAEQHFSAAKGEHPVPQLAIEFLSKSETAEDIADKINDYFASGVKMVWYIYPKTEMIYAYTSPKDIKVCIGEDICSAAPVIPDFQFPTKEIFNKEPIL